jgi:hypothetical protein
MKGVVMMVMLYVAAKIGVAVIDFSAGILREIIRGIVMLPSR